MQIRVSTGAVIDCTRSDDHPVGIDTLIVDILVTLWYSVMITFHDNWLLEMKWQIEFVASNFGTWSSRAYFRFSELFL